MTRYAPYVTRVTRYAPYVGERCGVVFSSVLFFCHMYRDLPERELPGMVRQQVFYRPTKMSDDDLKKAVGPIPQAIAAGRKQQMRMLKIH